MWRLVRNYSNVQRLFWYTTAPSCLAKQPLGFRAWGVSLSDTRGSNCKQNRLVVISKPLVGTFHAYILISHLDYHKKECAVKRKNVCFDRIIKTVYIVLLHAEMVVLSRTWYPYFNRTWNDVFFVLFEFCLICMLQYVLFICVSIILIPLFMIKN